MTTFTTEDRIAMQASMNANELADALESWAKGLFPMPGQLYLKAAAMLRQQQAEIESLKEKVMKNTYSEEKVDLCKEKLKPVAELVLEQMAVGDASSLRIKWLMDGYPPVGTKLYTQSNAQLHPLTDEEMMKAEYEFMYWNRSLEKPLVEIAYELGVFKQAVAILRKASEK